MKEIILNLVNEYPTLLTKYGITNNLRRSHFFSQLYHESGLIPKNENLNYSAPRLVEVFKKYFPDIASTNGYVGHPDKIANKVYADRMGNGNEASGDGWKYRGRGFIQITGKDLYTRLSKATGIDFINHPELLLEESNSLIAALWYWNTINANDLADRDDINTITKRINGGLNGLPSRKQLLISCKEIFK